MASSKGDLKNHNLIGFDRSDLLLRGFASYGINLTREHFAFRTDDGLLTWNLLLAGGGVGVAQVIIAKRHDELERVEAGIDLGALPVWLVMSEEVRSNARIRRVADFLSEAVASLLRSPV